MALQPIPRTAPTPIDGIRAVGDLQSKRVKVAVQDKILLWEPEAAPLTLLTAGIKGSRVVGRADYDWLEQDPYPREIKISGEFAAGVSVVNVVAGHGSRVAKYYVYKNRRTREVFWVQSVATDALTTQRGKGGFSDAMVDGDLCEFIGTAYEEGSDLGSLKSVVENREWNWTEIFRTPYGDTGRNVNADLYGGRDPQSTRQAKAIEHKQDMELAAFFGVRDSFTGPGGKVVTMTGGAEFSIKSNVFNFAGTPLSERAYVETLEYAMRFGMGGAVGGSGGGGGTMKKWFFASRRWITELEMMAKNRIQILQSATLSKYGLSLKTYESTHGTVVLVPMNVFQGDHARFGFLLDMNHVHAVTFKGRDTKILEDRGGNGVDGQTEEFLTDRGYQFEVEGSHSLYLLPGA